MLGLETIVEIGLQADAATFNTTKRQALNVYAITGGETRSRPADNILAGGMNNLSDPTAPAPGLPTHRLTVRGPLCSAQSAFWLRAFFGLPVTEDEDDPDFEHLFASGVAAPYVSIQHQRQTGDFSRHVGCVGEELKIKLDPAAEGFGDFEMTFVGIEETVHNASGAGVVTAAPALARPAQRLSKVIYNGVAGGDIMTGEFTFKRKLKVIRAADGTGKPLRIELDGRSELGGQLHCRYKDQTMLSDARSDTERSVVLELAASLTRGVRFTMAHALLDVVPVGASGPDGVEIDIPLTAYQNTADPALRARAQTALADFSTMLAA